MRVLTGMSGGVDSSVAALLLKEKGYEVIGATMSIWGKGGVYKKIQEKLASFKKSSHGACLGPDEKEDIEAAKRICEILDIPFYVFDCAEQYEEIVLKNFKKEYLEGRTPNPCVWCNALIKFDVLPHLAKLNGIAFDKFATGHYARVEEENGRYILKKGINPKKDQSYFLYRLKQEQLKNILLPLGNFSKEEIRQIAKEHNLPVADKPDSQDFYEGDYNELLQVEDKIGNIVDKDGNILGQHKGIWNYTIGQRKGLGISSTEALYVIELDKEKNEVIVGNKEKTFKNELIAKDLNYVSVAQVTAGRCCQAKIRSTQEPQSVIIEPINNNEIKVIFDNMQKSISIGQSVVLYDGEKVLGGGIIDKVL
ncbi:MAG: tRNA 2-thiouridine(34) synthase MnmA [bacterium]|nr:tRNA 2-thiouridine(34) synthase MnmA [bacterium]